MDDARQSPIWPYICILACLFILSVMAPRSWQSLAVRPTASKPPVMARVQPASPPPPAIAAPAIPVAATEPSVPVTVEAAREPADIVDAVESPPASGEPPQLAGATPPPVEQGLPLLSIELDTAQARQELDEQFEAEPELAPLEPPVAERIELDPSVAEAIPLPSQTEASPGNLTLSEEPDASAEQVPAEESPGNAPLPKNEEALAAHVTGWPYPSTLVRQLEELADGGPLQAWAERVAVVLERLSRLESLDDPQSATLLDRLQALQEQATTLAQDTASLKMRSRLLRARYGLTRRLAVWRHVHGLTSQVTLTASASRRPELLMRQLDAVELRLRGVRNGSSWLDYFLIDQLQRAAAGNPLDRRLLAREVLHRLESPQLSQQQQQFFTASPFAELTHELRYWASEPVDYRQLLASLERYEQTGDAHHAQELAGYYQALRWNTSEPTAAAGEALNTHYRNANVRIAISADLINRILPSLPAMDEPVKDQILGAQVSGRSRTTTKLQVRLLPDGSRWRLALEAQGQVASRTSSSKGPATFYSDGLSHYRAQKYLNIDERGIHLFRTQAEAASDSQLTGVETDFDDVPLVNIFARAYAVQQHDSLHADARWEMEGRVADAVRNRMDQSVEQRLVDAQYSVRRQVLEPLQRLQLDPTAVDMHTTPDRLIARYRLASATQIAAYTPRPQALSDSLLSVQLHESALNNALEQLELEGRRMTLHELWRELTNLLNLSAVETPEDIPEDVVVQFADKQAVRIYLGDGQAELRIRLAELADGTRRRWRNFEVHAFYRPEAGRMQATLVRDGIIHLGGELGFRDRLPLRAIFSKVLAKSRDVELIGPRMAEHPQLQDLQVTQLVIYDGWLGLAIGPRRS